MKNVIEQYLIANNCCKMNIKAVFFDMDGVLFNSMPFHASAWVRVFNDYNIPFSEQEAYMNEGRTGSSTVNEYFLKYKGVSPTQEQIEEIYSLKSRYFNEISTVKKIEGVSELLAILKNKDLDLYVVTGSGQKSLLNTLNEYFPNVFEEDKIVSAFNVKHGKPHPEPYLLAMQKAGVESHEAFVVENAPLGVKSSSAAGLFTVAVNTGGLPDDVLYGYGAHIVYDDMKTLTKNLFHLVNA